VKEGVIAIPEIQRPRECHKGTRSGGIGPLRSGPTLRAHGSTTISKVERKGLMAKKISEYYEEL
jgi:hypothetical protein